MNSEYSKFISVNNGSSLMRQIPLANGGAVIFLIVTEDLNVLKTQNKFVNFDTASDQKLADLGEITPGQSITFQWVNNLGFVRT